MPLFSFPHDFLAETIKAGIAAGIKKFGAIHGVVNSAGIGSATRVRFPSPLPRLLT